MLRTDRWDPGAGAARVHSESFLQALGIEPGSARAGDVGYEQVCGLLREVGAEDSIAILFSFAFCNYLLGNDDSVYDARAALLYTPEGPVLSPFPALTSAGAYEPPQRDHSPRTVYGLIRDNLHRAGLAPNAIGGDSELRDDVLRAVQITAGLGDALKSVAARAKQQGWHRQLIDRIPPRAGRHLFFRLDELDE